MPQVGSLGLAWTFRIAVDSGFAGGFSSCCQHGSFFDRCSSPDLEGVRIGCRNSPFASFHRGFGGIASLGSDDSGASCTSSWMAMIVTLVAILAVAQYSAGTVAASGSLHSCHLCSLCT